jgi:serine/threonine protein phosphatase PrpC
MGRGGDEERTAGVTPAPGRRVLGASVRGPIHRRDGLPNQDAMAWWGPDPRGRVVVAVADGHGSRKSFRSQMGAQLAVAVAVAVGRALAENAEGDGPPGPDFAAVATEIVERWTAAVQGHLDTVPILEVELAGVEEQEGQPARQAVEAEPVLAYGATLLMAVMLGSWAIVLQLGDGDILTVSPAGRTSRPMPDDSRLFGNETTSLCMRSAERQFRCGTSSVAADEVAVLILATDGVGNAYPDQAALAQVGADLLERISNEGPEAVSGELESYLQEAAQHSGDDTTMVVVWMGADSRERRPPSLERRLSWGEPVTWPPANP